MNKKEFKKVYSLMRFRISEFNSRLENSNWPCGYDDYMCEKFEIGLNKFLDKYPILRKVKFYKDEFWNDKQYHAITDEFKTIQYELEYNREVRLS
jgi:hypothetical protein